MAKYRRWGSLELVLEDWDRLSGNDFMGQVGWRQ